jgi:hypothetical protein
MNPGDLERQEWEWALERLGRSTRPGRLLQFIGSKYFAAQENQLTEVDIAIEVFGRSAKTFDPTEDAVVRVEAHRLRKKLRDLYEKDGATRALKISLPAGTYVPKFVAPSEPAAVPLDSPIAPPPVPKRRATRWIVPGAALLILGALIVGVLVSQRSADVPAAAATPAPIAPTTPPPAAPEGQISELHIMAGNSGSEVIDASGVRWTPDRYYIQGGVWARENGFVRGTSRPFLFTSWRTGEFGYNIPLAPGSYELRLFFISPQRAGDEKLASFDVALNGKPLLRAFDITMSANGTDRAEEQVFRDVSPNDNGILSLWFSNQAGSPLLNALSIDPGTPGKLNPIRIIAQPTSYVDHKGQRWRADDYFINGFRSSERRKVSGTKDAELFGAERFGRFSYAIPVDVRGRYTVVLHFAEFYHGPELPGRGGIGSRVFHVFCNGQTLLRDFDIYKEAGSLHVISKKFENIQPSAQGKINLDFEPVRNLATISGIEILDESG